MKITVINGPNLNFLGIREPGLYGETNYQALLEKIRVHAAEIGVEVECLQSNHEGDLVDFIQACYGKSQGIVMNAGAYTHTSIAILDALKAVGVPCVEVHITDVNAREDFRKISYMRMACKKTISGHGIQGYLEAMDFLKEITTEKQTKNA